MHPEVVTCNVAGHPAHLSGRDVLDGEPAEVGLAPPPVPRVLLLAGLDHGRRGGGRRRAEEDGAASRIEAGLQGSHPAIGERTGLLGLRECYSLL